MSESALERRFHTFDIARSENRAVADFFGKAESVAELVRNRLGFPRVRAVDADVHELEVEHLFDSLLAKRGDSVPILGVQKLAGDYPAAAAANDFVIGKIAVDIVRVYAARGHKAHICIGSADGLYVVESARLFRGEELDEVEPELQRLLYFACGGYAGGERYAAVQTVLNDFGVKTGGDAELCARRVSRVRLFAGEHRAGADEHIGISRRHTSDHFVRALCPERDLRAVNSAVAESLCKLFRILHLIELYDGHDTHVAELFHYLVDFFFDRHKLTFFSLFSHARRARFHTF